MPHRRLRGLIAADEAIVILHLRRMLRSAGFEIVSTARDSQEVIDLARQIQPDFLVMDLVMDSDRPNPDMPNVGGMEVTRCIMAERPVPIILLSAYDSVESRQAAREAGAMGFTTKPVQQSDLVKVVREAIAAFHSRHPVSWSS